MCAIMAASAFLLMSCGVGCMTGSWTAFHIVVIPDHAGLVVGRHGAFFAESLVAECGLHQLLRSEFYIQCICVETISVVDMQHEPL